MISLSYLALRWVLALTALRVRSDDFKELEIVVLRHELATTWLGKGCLSRMQAMARQAARAGGEPSVRSDPAARHLDVPVEVDPFTTVQRHRHVLGPQGRAPAQSAGQARGARPDVSAQRFGRGRLLVGR